MKLTKQTKNLMKAVKTVTVKHGEQDIEISLRQLNGAMRMERILTICKLRDTGIDMKTMKDNPEEAANALSTDALVLMEEMRNKLVMFSIVDQVGETASDLWEQVYSTVDEMRDCMPDELIDAVWNEVMSFNAFDEKSKAEIKADFLESRN